MISRTTYLDRTRYAQSSLEDVLPGDIWDMISIELIFLSVLMTEVFRTGSFQTVLRNLLHELNLPDWSLTGSSSQLLLSSGPQYASASQNHTQLDQFEHLLRHPWEL